MDFQLNEAQKMLVDLADRIGREEFAQSGALGPQPRVSP